MDKPQNDGVQSIPIFVLSFRALSRAPMVEMTRRGVAEIALCLAAIAALIAMHDIPITHDVVWQFWVARQLVNGAVLYRDIWEINPPLWFWSALPIHHVATWLHIPPLRLLVIVVVGAGTLSALLVGRLSGITSPVARLMAMLLAFALVVVTPLYDFGQREQLALICALPYAALIARRSTGNPVPSALALLVGAMGAYGFALKHYFVFVPVILELWFIVRTRPHWRAFRPETLTLAVAALAYGVAAFLFAPAFFSQAVPMSRIAYHGFESSWEMMLVRPWIVIWTFITAFFLTFSGAFGRKANPFVSTLLLVAIGFGLAYFLQRKGWMYHSIPITGAMAMALGVRLTMPDMRRVVPIAVGLFMLALPLLMPVKVGAYFNFFRSEIDPLLSTLPRGSPIFMATGDPMWGWPTVEDHGLVWTSRLPSYWMIPAIAHAEVIGPNPAPLRALSRKIRDQASLEIICSSPALIMFERRGNYVYQPRSFDVRGFFLRQAVLRSYLERNYRELTPTDSLYIYRRVAPSVIARRGPECPKFTIPPL